MTCEKKLQVGDFGAEIVLVFWNCDQPRDISAALTREVIFTKPDDTVVPKPALFVTGGLDGAIKYVIETGLIDQAGIWDIQGRVAGTGFEARTEKTRLEVLGN